MRKRTGSESGIVLMLVIWVMAVLLVIVLSVSMAARSQTMSTLAFKDQTQEKFLAEAGIQRGIMEINYANKTGGGLELAGEAWKEDGTPYTRQLGSGHYSVKIVGETGKLDINMVPDVLLKNLMKQLGMQDEDADIVVDSIMDWKDPSGLSRPNGAGADYYESLPNPYKPKGANFEELEELLLVRGITPQLLYGTGKRKGLIDFLTVNSKSTAVNVNYAPKEVLLSLPGMGPELADQIITYRESKNISSPQELQALLGPVYGTVSPYITPAGTNVFTIESTGFINKQEEGYPIRATVMMDFTNNSYKYLYYKSPAYRE